MNESEAFGKELDRLAGDKQESVPDAFKGPIFNEWEELEKEEAVLKEKLKSADETSREAVETRLREIAARTNELEDLLHWDEADREKQLEKMRQGDYF